MKANMQSRNLKYTAKRPYKCDTCGAHFASRDVLRKHERIHTGTKPFKCDTCDAHFITGGNLKVHIRTHTGEKPYKCDVCGKSLQEMVT